MNKDKTWRSVRRSVGYGIGKSNAHSIWKSIGGRARISVEDLVEHLVWSSVEDSVWDPIDDSLEEAVYE